MLKRKVQEILRTVGRVTVSAFVRSLDEGAWL
jgi:hypothetical protein